MKRASSNSLRLCPDCGAILELTHPAWVSAIAMAAAADPPERRPASWLCPICGYQERHGEPSSAPVA